MVVHWAIEKGLFTLEGLNVVPWTVESGTAATQAMVAGSSDVHSGAFSLFVTAKAGGADIWAFFHGGDSNFIYATYKDSLVKNITDLKGKKIGITRYGSGSDLGIRALLAKYGLDADKDAQLIQVGTSGALPGLINKELDAAFVGLRDVSVGDLRVIAVLNDELPGYQPSVYFTRGDFIREYPDALKRFSRVTLIAQEQLRNNPDEAVKFYAKLTGLAEPEAKSIFEFEEKFWPKDGRFAGKEDGLKLTIDWLVKLKIIKEPIPLSELIKYDFVP